MELSKIDWVKYQQLYTQCVIEARNISLGIGISLKYRIEMIIGLLEVSLANLGDANNQFRKNAESGSQHGFSDFSEMKEWLDLELLSLNSCCQEILSNFSSSVQERLFKYLIPKKRPEIVNKFIER